MARQKELPEESELVLCTVTKIYNHCVFANLDEYTGKSGMIHISEISPGRIRNIHDYVRVGKKIICKVLQINYERGNIDLSLRRVSEGQKREKAELMKRQQKVEKIVEFVADKLKIDAGRLLADIEDQLAKDYDEVHDFFEEYVADESVMKVLKLPPKTLELLGEVIKQRIKPPIVVIEGEISLSTFSPDGVEVIKSILMDAEKVDESIIIRYKGAGKYTVSITQEDYKTAEGIMESMKSNIEKSAKKLDVNYGFERLEKKAKKAAA